MKNLGKKSSLVFFGLILSFSLVACSREEEPVDVQPSNTETSTEVEIETPTETPEVSESPTPTESSTPTPTLSETEQADGSSTKDANYVKRNDNEAMVENVDAVDYSDSTLMIKTMANGNHPDGCTSIDKFSWSQSGNTFVVDLLTKKSGEMCTQALVPFSQKIELKVQKALKAGKYTVDVNGVKMDFEVVE